MRTSMQMCKQSSLIQNTMVIPTKLKNNINDYFFNLQLPRQKVVFVMGPTGTGKSRLSIDLATHFPAEIINSDKIQIYKGLDIITNKVTQEEQRGVPHHLLGVINPNENFTSKSFCRAATTAVESVHTRRKLPIIVGGSNSYIESLVDDKHHGLSSKYDCCFLWVDVAMPVLSHFLDKRVDKMVKAGMVDEVRKFHDPDSSYHTGIRTAIGVPEFDALMKYEASLAGSDDQDDTIRRMLEEAAINEVKRNTQVLARKQLAKIYRLRDYKKWMMQRIDATSVFLKKGDEQEWDKNVAKRAIKIVSMFVDDFTPNLRHGQGHGVEDSSTVIAAAAAAVVR